MLRRLYPDQPEGFAFTPANQAWAEAQITKFPEGRQASAIIPLLWRAQEQEGWLTRPAIEHVAAMLDLAYIRALEVATFYFMFQLQAVARSPMSSVCGISPPALILRRGRTSIDRLPRKIAPRPHEISRGRQSSTWEEVECLGACANAAVGPDREGIIYEDLTAEKLRRHHFVRASRTARAATLVSRTGANSGPRVRSAVSPRSGLRRQPPVRAMYLGLRGRWRWGRHDQADSYGTDGAAQPPPWRRCRRTISDPAPSSARRCTIARK